MRNLKLFNFIFLFLFPGILIAQYSKFDLSRYKLPDIKLDRFDATFDLGNDLNRNYSEISSMETSESRSDNFQGSLNLSYYRFRNTAKYQGDLLVTTNGSTSLNKQRINDFYSKNNHNNVNFQIISTNRFYSQKRNFIEVDPGLSISNSQNKYYYEHPPMTTQDVSNNQFIASVSVPVSIGHGRIEPIEDLRLALYIIEELNKAGRIGSLPSDNIILEMAKEISKIKRQRFFDSRLRKIKELQVIDSFLVANKVISTNDIKYFAVLNDQWDYASGPVRSAGFAVNAGIDDRVLLDRSRHSSFSMGMSPARSEESSDYYYIAGFVQARYYKPVNLYWQTSASLKTSYGTEIIRNPLDKSNQFENYRNNVFSTILQCTIQYLPNSRTSVGLDFSGNYKNSGGNRSFPDPDPVTFYMNEDLLTLQTGFNMYYYISPKVRLNLNSDLYYFVNNVSNDTQPDIERLNHSFNHTFTLTLTYSFF